MESQPNGQLHQAVKDLEPQMRALLQSSLRIPSVSGSEAEFVGFIEEFARDSGLTTQTWETDEADLVGYPVMDNNHLPLAGRPTLLVGLPGAGTGSSLLFNAHSDVVSAGRPDQWTFGPWSGIEYEGCFYGRGACDVKGPLVSALWAMLAIQKLHPAGPAGPVQLELIPGEEDCVTLGTLTSIVHGVKADACIVLEPTECVPRNASRPGARFEIVCSGKAVHGSVKWEGQDAIQFAGALLSHLNQLETKWNHRDPDDLFSVYPIARPITVDKINGGEWQGMLCSKCNIEGYLELLPDDDITEWTTRFGAELTHFLEKHELHPQTVSVRFPESYPGHSTDFSSPLCLLTEQVLQLSRDAISAAGKKWIGWSGFNSGCEAGMRAGLQRTPTLVWGPGSLVQAHRVDEFIDFAHVRLVAELFAKLINTQRFLN
jgi:acetylornithine deacetylase